MAEFWENLKNGKDCIVEIPKERWDYRDYYDPDPDKPGATYGKWGGFIDDADKFDSLFFNIAPREAELIDPQERLFLETVWETVEDAGYTRAGLAGQKVGIFVGVMYGQYQLYGAEAGARGGAPGSSYASVANRVSYCFNFQGPSIALDTMCSSSLTAVHLACESIQRGECAVTIAGGVNIASHPNKYLQLSQGKFLSGAGRCRSFGAGGDGYVPGEGVGAIMLKPLRKALADRDHVYAVIKGSSINHGGKTNGYTVPNPNAQAELIGDAIRQAKVDPRTISYIEAHGTGTSLGDPIEITGLMKAFREYTPDRQFCAIGSAKSNIGHLESAAGIAGITKVLLQMRHKQMAPSIHSETLNPHINFVESPFYVQRELSDWLPPVLVENGLEKKYLLRAGISSFGAGGANGHLILEAYEAPDRDPKPAGEPRIIVLSAQNQDRLKVTATNLLAFLEKPARAVKVQSDKIDISDLAFTLQVGREPMEERLALVVESLAELKEKLGGYCRGDLAAENVYHGNITDGFARQSVIQGNPGAEFLKMIIAERDYPKIAQLWVLGIPVAWESLTPEAGPAVRRISLPTYPFARERHWISDRIAAVPRRGAGIELHPLIDSNESTLEEQCYRKEFTGNEFLVKDHIIGGKQVLPGAVYLEMARLAGELAMRRAHKVKRITNTVWIRPVTLEEGSREIYIGLYPERDNVAYEISSSYGDGERIIHAQGRIIYGNEDSGIPETEMIDIEAIKGRAAIHNSGAECYREFQALGFEYGNSFQTIRELYCSETESLSRLELAAELEPEYPKYGLHPSIIDGALQTVSGSSGIGEMAYNCLLP